MKISNLKYKLEKGKSLEADIIYIKEDNFLYGIGDIYKDENRKNIILIKSNEESLNVEGFINILDNFLNNLGDIDILIGNDENYKESIKDIKNIEFAQYESTKMLFINI